MIVALAGGVGGAKFARGLAMVLAPEELLTVVNTGDDFVHYGLHISPDVDTVMYWLAGIQDSERGWGLANETWHFMDAIKRIGGATWFQLGDSDLATHAERTRQLASGASLSEVTSSLCQALGVKHQIAPMTDDHFVTLVETDEGRLAFQEYFVERRCAPCFRGVRFPNRGTPSKMFDTALNNPELTAILIGPSNPILSIEPILSLESVRPRIEHRKCPVIATSPLVGGRAIKGPAAKMFIELGLEPTALSIARHYGHLIDGLVIDNCDEGLKASIEAIGTKVLVTNTVMQTPEHQRQLAADTCMFAKMLRARPRDA